MTAIGILAGVIGFLFRWSEMRVTRADLAVAKAEGEAEKLQLVHKEELVKVRIECAERLHVQAREFAEALRRDHLDNRVHEDEIRKEFVGVVATIGDQTSKSAASLTEVLAKLHDRFIAPQRRHS